MCFLLANFWQWTQRCLPRLFGCVCAGFRKSGGGALAAASAPKSNRTTLAPKLNSLLSLPLSLTHQQPTNQATSATCWPRQSAPSTLLSECFCVRGKERERERESCSLGGVRACVCCCCSCMCFDRSPYAAPPCRRALPSSPLFRAHPLPPNTPASLFPSFPNSCTYNGQSIDPARHTCVVVV